MLRSAPGSPSLLGWLGWPSLLPNKQQQAHKSSFKSARLPLQRDVQNFQMRTEHSNKCSNTLKLQPKMYREARHTNPRPVLPITNVCPDVMLSKASSATLWVSALGVFPSTRLSYCPQQHRKTSRNIPASPSESTAAISTSPSRDEGQRTPDFGGRPTHSQPAEKQTSHGRGSHEGAGRQVGPPSPRFQ